MSHTTTVRSAFTDIPALTRAAVHLGGTLTEHETVTLYENRQSITGTVVRLPGWKYPVVITDAGELKYDHYNGKWGDPDLLRQLQVRYGMEVALMDAEANGQVATISEDEVDMIVEIEVED